ncbi:hypothetical protein KCV26_12300 [Petrimonas sulfuriphila]|jgi:hypothetical protein|uniref:hypothetical protein n=1 Tax=Petrimonas TaxID=307628 RepID=UPI002B3F8F9C|nr:hypothetical protein [Petrimonas sp.]
MNDNELSSLLEGGAEVINTPRKPEIASVYKERVEQKTTTFDYALLEQVSYLLIIWYWKKLCQWIGLFLTDTPTG